jgi:hypothetical protein
VLGGMLRHRSARPSRRRHFERQNSLPLSAQRVAPLESSFAIVLNQHAELLLGPVTKDGYPVLLIRFVKQSSLEFGTHLVRQADRVLEVGLY